MPNKVTITKKLETGGWVITGSVDFVAPTIKEIFVYENTGEAQLGAFHSVSMVADLPKIPVWAGTPIRTAVTLYVRTNQVNIKVPADYDVDQAISELLSSIRKFLAEYNAVKENTKIYVVD